MIPIRNAVPSRYPPVVTWMLIAINCLVFLFQDSLGPDELELFLRQFALIPARYSEAFASGEVRGAPRSNPAQQRHAKGETVSHAEFIESR